MIENWNPVSMGEYIFWFFSLPILFVGVVYLGVLLFRLVRDTWFSLKENRGKV